MSNRYRSPFLVDGVPTKAGGAPTRFYGWFGVSYFVDYDAGADANTGLDTAHAFKNLAAALAVAGPDDVIYVRGRNNTAALAPTDPLTITPATAANWIVARTQQGLSIVGCSQGLGNQNQVRRVVLQGHASVNTDTFGSSVLTVKAPFVTIENMGFAHGATLRALLEFYGEGTGTIANCYGSTAYNCLFRSGAAWGAAHPYGGVYNVDNWEIAVYDSFFDRLAVGILMYGSTSTIERIKIAGCGFRGAAAAQDAHIAIEGGGVDYIEIGPGNVFNTLKPANGGQYEKYIHTAAVTTRGVVYGNRFALANIDPAADLTLGANVVQVENYDVAGIVA